jgi:CRISPR/Cas system CSM-associated protein Csm3 (group 7 of RAMP superfamily)
MNDYTIKIKLLSDALPGSGEGYGAVIDADIVFDELGIPFIPAKRIKGCLRESANDVCAMLSASGPGSISLKFTGEKQDEFDIVKEIFGERGQEKSAPIYFSNLTLPQYEDNFNALYYFKEKYPALVSTEGIVETFTYIRQQTAIEEESGTADNHSLRSIRVLKKGVEFQGTVSLEKQEPGIDHLLQMACMNLRRFGSKRTRGFGEIECRLLKDGREINVDFLWEE